jgi:hypothetical protein
MEVMWEGEVTTASMSSDIENQNAGLRTSVCVSSVPTAVIELGKTYFREAGIAVIGSGMH